MSNVKTEPYVTELKTELDDIKWSLPPLTNIGNSSNNENNRSNTPAHNASDLKILKNRITALEEKLESLTSQKTIFSHQGKNFRKHSHNKNNFRPGLKLNNSDFNILQQNVNAAITRNLQTHINQECKQQFAIHQTNASATSIFVGIYDTYPISHERLIELKRSIILKIMKETKTDDVPCFNGFEFKLGWLLVICKDFKSLLWVYKNIPLLKPWYNANLDVRRCKDLPKINKIVVHAPTSEVDTSHEAITLLKAQNSCLDIDQWEIVEVVYEMETFQIYFNISDESLEDLNKLNYKPFFGLKQAVVEVVSKKEMEVVDVIEISD